MLAPRLQDIHDRINALVGLMPGYGVDSAALDQLQTAIAAFSAIKSAPRNVIVTRKGHNQSVPELLRSIRQDFYKLDRLIDIWADTDARFVTDYHNARMVLDLGTRHNPSVGPAA